MSDNKEYDIKTIIKCQKYIRGYLNRSKTLITPSYYQTKVWRKNRRWYKNGKHNTCEKYQARIFEDICYIRIIRNTKERFNINTYELKEYKNPMKYINGLNWTEDFDGKFTKNDIIYYVNFKFVCDSGGAQTRTIRELYHFINCQIKHTNLHNNSKYFINILDGDYCHKNIDKLKYNLSSDKYIFIGDMYEFQKNKWKYNL